MQNATSPASVTRGLSLIFFGCLFTAMPLFALWKEAQGGDGDAMKNQLGALLFVVIGLGILIGGITIVRRALRTKHLSVRYPDQPWMLRPDWASGRIREGDRGQTLFIVCFAAVWNLISCAVLLNFLKQKPTSYDATAFFISLFLLIGVVAAVVALYKLLRWRKYGTSVFELAEVPGVIGGSIGGVVLTRAKPTAQDGFSVRLRCIHRRVVSRGKNNSVHTEILWERQQLRVQAQHGSAQLRAVPVLFSIPYECRPTETISANESHYWELLVSAKTQGIDYKAVFYVPVYRTKDSSPAVRDGVEHLPQEEKDALGMDVRLVEGLRISQTLSGAERMDFKRFANGSGMFVVLAIVGAVMLGIMYQLWNTDAPRLILWVFVIVGALMLQTALSALLSKVHLVLHRDRIEVVRHFLGIALTPRAIPRDQIARIEIVQGIKIQNEAYYDLIIHTHKGKKTRIAARIHGQTQAELVRNHILQNGSHS